MSPSPRLPGGVAVSHLEVYSSAAPDDRLGGSPHVHLVCAEAYVVQEGSGRLQTLGPDGFVELALRPGDVVTFAPGVVHRLVNEDAALRILVLMENAGLPEAGDAVLCFPPDVLADAGAYRAAADVAGTGPAAEAAARERRDLAVRGFSVLCARVAEEGAPALERFLAAAAALVRERADEWEARWRAGSLAAATETGERLAALRSGRAPALADAWLERRGTDEHVAALGMCGRLARVEVG